MSPVVLSCLLPPCRDLCDNLPDEPRGFCRAKLSVNLCCIYLSFFGVKSYILVTVFAQLLCFYMFLLLCISLYLY